MPSARKVFPVPSKQRTIWIGLGCDIFLHWSFKTRSWSWRFATDGRSMSDRFIWMHWPSLFMSSYAYHDSFGLALLTMKTNFPASYLSPRLYPTYRWASFGRNATLWGHSIDVWYATDSSWWSEGRSWLMLRFLHPLALTPSRPTVRAHISPPAGDIRHHLNNYQRILLHMASGQNFLTSGISNSLLCALCPDFQSLGSN